MDLKQINLDLVRALGITDTANIRQVTLTIKADALPLISIERCIFCADGLRTAMEVLQLRGHSDLVDATCLEDEVARWARRA
jgi:hypothetical protein